MSGPPPSPEGRNWKILIEPVSTPDGYGIGQWDGWVWAMSPCHTARVVWNGDGEESVWLCAACDKELCSAEGASATGRICSGLYIDNGRVDQNVIADLVAGWTGFKREDIEVNW